MAKERLFVKAVNYVNKYEKEQKREVVDVQHAKGRFGGFDLLSFSKDKKEIRTIEVKGTKKKAAIPDLFETEVTRQKRLVATHLYIVSYANQKKPELFEIPASDIKPDHLTEKRIYKVSSTFQKGMGKYKVLKG